MYSYENGMSNDWQVTHLGARAVGGAGLVIAEATAVDPAGRITPHDAGLWSDDHIEPLTRVTKVIKAHGAVPGIQIGHAGRKASTNRPWTDNGQPIPADNPAGWPVVGPSPVAFNCGYQVPRELTVDEIHTIQNQFRDTARRALAAGFEWLESTPRTATCCITSIPLSPTIVRMTTAAVSRTGCACSSKRYARSGRCGLKTSAGCAHLSHRLDDGGGRWMIRQTGAHAEGGRG
jgi:hypothetical protein